jgi:NTE family protein
MKFIDTLIFGGGGIRGLSYIGALKYLYEIRESGKLKIDIKEICGVSVGTIFGLFYILGCTISEMEHEIIEKDLSKLKKISFMNFWGNWGLDTGENIILWLESLLLRKLEKTKKLTFGELYSIIPIKFNVLAGNLNRYEFEEFNHVKTPNVPVLDAIRMSIGIPIVFTKKVYNGDIILDGGIISSYPIDLYSDKLDTVLGFKSVSISEEKGSVYNKVDGLDTFLYNLFMCFMVQRERRIALDTRELKHTIQLFASLDDVLTFTLTKEEKLEMITLGYLQAKETFEKNWELEKKEV